MLKAGVRTVLVTLVVAAVALATAPVGANADQTDPTAVIVRTTGDVRLQLGGTSAPAAASVGAPLVAGDRVIVGESGSAILLFRTGRTQEVGESVVIEEPDRGERAGAFVRAVATLREVATTDARQHPNRQGMIRPVPGEPVPVAPRNRIVLLDARPTFTWFRVPDVDRYAIQLRRVSGGPIMRFDVGADTSWTLPPSSPPLVPGEEYEWTVGPADGGRVVRPQRFRIIGADAYAALATSLRDLAAAGLDPAGDGRFLAALAYRDAGLYYEARRLLDALAAEAVTGAAFHRLRGEVFDALGDLEAAAREFARAEAAEDRGGGT